MNNGYLFCMECIWLKMKYWYYRKYEYLIDIKNECKE